MTDITAFGAESDTSFVRQLIEEYGVAGVPGSSFYRPASDGSKKVRFMWAKKDETLHAAGERLRKLRTLIS
jgi:aminotransferase